VVDEEFLSLVSKITAAVKPTIGSLSLELYQETCSYLMTEPHTEWGTSTK